MVWDNQFVVCTYWLVIAEPFTWCLVALKQLHQGFAMILVSFILRDVLKIKVLNDALPLTDFHHVFLVESNLSQSIVYISASIDILPCSERIGEGSDSGRFYTSSFSLSSVIERHSTLHHSYDDDSQLQNSATPSTLPDLIEYFDDIKDSKLQGQNLEQVNSFKYLGTVRHWLIMENWMPR